MTDQSSPVISHEDHHEMVEETTIQLKRMTMRCSRDAVALSWPFFWRVRRHLFVLGMGWGLCAVASWVLSTISSREQPLWLMGTTLVMPMIFLAATLPSIVAQYQKKTAMISCADGGLSITQSLYYDFDTVVRFKLYEWRHGEVESMSDIGALEQQMAWRAIALPDHLLVLFYKRSGERVPIVFERGSPEAIQRASKAIQGLLSG